MTPPTPHHQTPDDTAPGVRGRLLGALATLLLAFLVSGVPVLLIRIGATPIPTRTPRLDQIWAALTRPDDGTALITALAVIAWIAWLVLAVAILVELTGTIRGIPAPHLPGLSHPQALARRLIATAALLFTALPTVTTATAQPAHGATAAPATTVATSTLTPGVRTPPTASHPTATQAAAAGPTPVAAATPPTPPTPRTIRHTVKPGESLWSIAAHHLGSGSQWRRIADANHDLLGDNPGFLTAGTILTIPLADTPTHAPQTRAPARPHHHTHDGRHVVQPGDTLSAIAAADLGDASAWPQVAAATRATVQPDGRHLVDPDLIYAGWVITLPDHHTTDHAAGTSRPAVPDQGAPPPTTTPAPRTPAPAATATRSPRPADDPRQDTRARPGPALPAPQPGQVPGGSAARTDAPAPPGQATATAAAADHGTSPAVPGLLAGAGFAAGSMLLVLRRRRRDQFRARRPGRTITVPPADLVPIEKQLTRTGSRFDQIVDAVDQLLRRLAADQAQHRRPMPALAAVEAHHQGITVHLSEPADLPHPWTDPDQTRMRWRATPADLDDPPPIQDDTQPAPYPLLVTIGHAADGAIWLMNSEEFGAFSITGDPDRVTDLARHITAELATAPWTSMARVDCIGIGAEAADMDRHRLSFHATPEAARAAITRAVTDTVETLDRADTENITDTATARAHQHGDDVWPARLLILDTHHHGTDIGPETDTDPDPTAIPDAPATPGASAIPGSVDEALAAMVGVVRDHPHRTGTVVIAVGATHLAPTVLHVSDTGSLTVAGVGLELTAARLTAAEAAGCAALLACAQDLTGIPVPPMSDDQGWHAHADAAGALRTVHTIARHTPPDPDQPTTTLLDHPDQTYLDIAATTVTDIHTLAPDVPTTVRDLVEDSDPDLDTDLAAWADPTCPRPRLTLLGPVELRTQPGTTTPARIGFHTDLAAYLATHPRGVTSDEAADAFQITASRLRAGMNHLRHWLGTDPTTGAWYLPMATKSPAGLARGQGIYQLTDTLVDADLFRRLRVRGQARGGPEGHTDLHRALALVTGPVFGQLRAGGWTWLLEGDRIDHHLVVAIVDVAHTLVTDALARGDHTTARTAAQTALLAAPHEDIPRLDLAAITAAEGRAADAQRLAQQHIIDRTDDGQPPADLSPRTQHILTDHHWTHPTRRRHTA